MPLQANLVNIGNGASAYQRASEAAINRLRTVTDNIGSAAQAVAKEVERPQREQLNALLANDDFDGAEQFVNANSNRLLNSSAALEGIGNAREAFDADARTKLQADQQFEDNQLFRENRGVRNDLYGQISTASLEELDALEQQVTDSPVQDKKPFFDQINQVRTARKNEAETIRQRGLQAAQLGLQQQDRADRKAFGQLQSEVSSLMADGDYEGALALAKSSNLPRRGEIINSLVQQKNLTDENAVTAVPQVISALDATAQLSPFVQKAQAQVAAVDQEIADLGTFDSETGPKYTTAPLQLLQDSLRKNGGVDEKKLGEAADDLQKDFNKLTVTYGGQDDVFVKNLPSELIARAVESVGWRSSSVFDDVYGKDAIQGIIDSASADLALRKAKKTELDAKKKQLQFVYDTQVDDTKLQAVNALINRANAKSHPQYRTWTRARASIIKTQGERAKANISPTNRLTN